MGKNVKKGILYSYANLNYCFAVLMPGFVFLNIAWDYPDKDLELVK